MNENMRTMNEKQQAANGREAYEAPKCEIIEMQQEGVLCGSVGASNDSFGEENVGSIWDRN